MAVDCRDPALGVRDVFFQCCDALAHKQPAPFGAHADQAYPAVGKVQHLRGARVENQLFDVLADKLFRADPHVDRYGVLGKQVPGVHVLCRTDAGDLGRRMEQGIGDLARHHVGLIGVGQGDDDIGIVGARALEHFGMCGVSDNGPDVEAVLQVAQDLRAHVHDGDFVSLFTGEVIRG